MYLDSILFNLLALFIVSKDPLRAFSPRSLSRLLDYRIALIVINSAVVGIITSFFLQKFNSILKVFAGALELVCTAVFSYFLFNIPVMANTVLSILIVIAALVLYTFSPVRNNTRENQAGVDPHTEIAPTSQTVAVMEMHEPIVC